MLAEPAMALLRPTCAVPSTVLGTKENALLPATLKSTAPSEGPSSTASEAEMMAAENLTCRATSAHQHCVVVSSQVLQCKRIDWTGAGQVTAAVAAAAAGQLQFRGLLCILMKVGFPAKIPLQVSLHQLTIKASAAGQRCDNHREAQKRIHGRTGSRKLVSAMSGNVVVTLVCVGTYGDASMPARPALWLPTDTYLGVTPSHCVCRLKLLFPFHVMQQSGLPWTYLLLVCMAGPELRR